MVWEVVVEGLMCRGKKGNGRQINEQDALRRETTHLAANLSILAVKDPRRSLSTPSHLSTPKEPTRTT